MTRCGIPFKVKSNQTITEKRKESHMNSLHTYEPKDKDLLGKFEADKEAEHRRQLREELSEEISRLDNVAFVSASRACPTCGGALHGHGKCGTKSYHASCGEVRVRLRRLRCSACGRIIVPGLGLLPEDSISACLGEKMCDLASKMPYAKATESLAIQHGIHISVKHYWAFIQKEAALIKDVVKKEADALYEYGVEPDSVDLKGEKPLIIGIDGGHVKGWKTTPSHEVKCATIATGSRQVSDKNDRRKLTDRVGYAAECSADDFRKRISTLAIKSGYLTASERIFVSDGASWISKMISEWFPDAIHVLDMYHLKHRVEMLFGIKVDDDTASLRDEALDICGSYDPDLLIDFIAAWKPKDNTKLEDQAELITYITNNAEAIRNHHLVFIHGSGWIEKGVDLMISRRLKNRGMSWTVHGCSNLIPFAVLRYNRQWSVYWNNRKGLDLANQA